jgi:hypothetical protein
MIHPVELPGSVLGEDITAVGAACIVLEDILAPRSGGFMPERASFGLDRLICGTARVRFFGNGALRSA